VGNTGFAPGLCGPTHKAKTQSPVAKPGNVITEAMEVYPKFKTSKKKKESPVEHSYGNRKG